MKTFEGSVVDLERSSVRKFSMSKSQTLSRLVCVVGRLLQDDDHHNAVGLIKCHLPISKLSMSDGQVDKLHDIGQDLSRVDHLSIRKLAW